MSIYTEILQKYWGYDNFRHPQEEIIESVAAGKDTLGLMPTGGGKSITFQVYSMSKKGVCLVITPLIALMKDQVENLHKKKIKAAAIYSGMTKTEIEVVLNNAINGYTKFLYISPERLKNFYFKERLKNMRVNLITVDEAHCISQWGYDFRPSYLEIAEIRKDLPNVPVLALTATATPQVVEDIQNKLLFKQYNVIQKSFERKNLVYYVIHAEDKINILFKLLNKVQGSGVFYVRNRKKTKEYAMLLQKFGVSADYYHAGLTSEIRAAKQNAWQNNEIRIMVCTNAFGMGIDKPDVRIVIHLDLPDSLEAYFQEAGRAGRDGKQAYAFLVFNNSDTAQLKKNITMSFPDLKKIAEIYDSICNHLQIPINTGKDTDFNFNIFNFAKIYKFDLITIINSLKLLEISEILEYCEDVNSSSRIMFTVNRDDLYNFQLYSEYDEFIKLILRTHTGVFNDFVTIYEENLAVKANTNIETIINWLKTLQSQKIIKYIPRSIEPIIHFIEPRKEIDYSFFKVDKIEEQKERIIERLESMLLYATSRNKCRSQQLLAYFGEKNTRACGFCDVCISQTSIGITKYEFETIGITIKNILTEKNTLLRDLVDSISDFDANKVTKVIEWMLDNNRMSYNNERELEWNK